MPVHTFSELCARIHNLSPPSITSTLFVNCKDTSASVTTSTIASWLGRLIQLSIPQWHVNIRSLGSSIALLCGIPLEDIITLGNWSNSGVFHHHYRRENLSTIDFINTVLQPLDARSLSNNGQKNFAKKN